MTIEEFGRKPLSIPPIDDPQVRFYLDHWHAIETWAALRRDADEALQDRLLDLVDVLADDARTIGDDIDIHTDTSDRRKPRIAISRRSWRDAAGRVPAATVIEWQKPLIDRDGELQLYVGLRVGERRRRDQQVGAQLSGLAAAFRQRLGRPWEREDEAFPVWRWVTVPGTVIDEIALLEDARAGAWDCWNVTAGAIDDILAH
ncbi:hypothetical protein ACQP2P_02020 [Dactylosporangium sp. CA-139114]|uniref:hypothetical protein n=1 Tax=Dactylosporangium sp. CA-139114 TaxID=3239931 RepID=UPI003D9847C3